MPRDLMQLPHGWSTRAPALEDAVLVLEIVRTCEEAELGDAQVDLEDILGDWRRPNVDLSADGVLVLAPDSTPAAYAELSSSRAEGNVLPQYAGLGIGTWMAAWIERRAREVGSTFVRQVVPAGATPRLELLARAGYQAADMAWELSIDVPALGDRSVVTVAMADLAVRDFRPGIDDAAAHELIEEAFGHWPNREPASLEGWRAVTVLRAGFETWMFPLVWDGAELVGGAYCIDDAEEASTWIQQLAVRAARQGGGIGTMLLAECFERCAARGRTTVGLATDTRTGALGLYRRVGMSVVREFAGHVLAIDELTD